MENKILTNKQEILAHYKLSQEEHDKIYEVVKDAFSQGKTPVKNPTAVVIIGQTGSGKTSLISTSKKVFKDDNVIVINSDDFSCFHPKIKEFAEFYPDYFTELQGQETGTWTSEFFKWSREQGYNVIFETTGWNNRIVDDGIAELNRLGYNVIIRSMAVGDLTSRYSCINRYLNEMELKGYGRQVQVEHHDRSANGMPNTSNYAVDSKACTMLQVFGRGNKKIEPELIHNFIVKPDNLVKLLSNSNIDLNCLMPEEDPSGLLKDLKSDKELKPSDVIYHVREKSNDKALSNGQFMKNVKAFNPEKFPATANNVRDLKEHIELEMAKRGQELS